jgi:hypothetical protein
MLMQGSDQVDPVVQSQTEFAEKYQSIQIALYSALHFIQDQVTAGAQNALIILAHCQTMIQEALEFAHANNL